MINQPDNFDLIILYAPPTITNIIPIAKINCNTCITNPSPSISIPNMLCITNIPPYTPRANIPMNSALSDTCIILPHYHSQIKLTPVKTLDTKKITHRFDIVHPEKVKHIEVD